MARLPKPGGDDGEWGVILNEFLSEIHTPAGHLKPGIITQNNLHGSLTSLINSKAASSNLSPVATTGNYNDLTNKPALPQSSIVSVNVTTGSEARPSATTVLWIGGVTQPSNMVVGDLWFSTEEPQDTIAPTVPSGVTASSVTSLTFVLSWAPSADNQGVTAYEVIIDNQSYTITSNTSVQVAGRQQNTTYSCVVRARDSAGNWSATSSVCLVTTVESANVIHSVFNSLSYPGLTSNQDGQQITVATAFYTDMQGAAGWKVTGMRVFVPQSYTGTSPVQATLFAPLSGVAPNLESPVRAASQTVIPGAWNEFIFDSPYVLTPGLPVWSGYRFGDGTYFSTTAMGSNRIQAADGSVLYMAEETMTNGLRRNYYRYSGSTDGSAIGGQGYGIDIIVSEI